MKTLKELAENKIVSSIISFMEMEDQEKGMNSIIDFLTYEKEEGDRIEEDEENRVPNEDNKRNRAAKPIIYKNYQIDSYQALTTIFSDVADELKLRAQSTDALQEENFQSLMQAFCNQIEIGYFDAFFPDQNELNKKLDEAITAFIVNLASNQELGKLDLFLRRISQSENIRRQNQQQEDQQEIVGENHLSIDFVESGIGKLFAKLEEELEEAKSLERSDFGQYFGSRAYECIRKGASDRQIENIIFGNNAFTRLNFAEILGAEDLNNLSFEQALNLFRITSNYVAVILGRGNLNVLSRDGIIIDQQGLELIRQNLDNANLLGNLRQYATDIEVARLIIENGRGNFYGAAEELFKIFYPERGVDLPNFNSYIATAIKKVRNFEESLMTLLSCIPVNQNSIDRLGILFERYFPKEELSIHEYHDCHSHIAAKALCMESMVNEGGLLELYKNLSRQYLGLNFNNILIKTAIYQNNFEIISNDRVDLQQNCLSKIINFAKQEMHIRPGNIGSHIGGFFTNYDFKETGIISSTIKAICAGNHGQDEKKYYMSEIVVAIKNNTKCNSSDKQKAIRSIYESFSEEDKANYTQILLDKFPNFRSIRPTQASSLQNPNSRMDR